MKFEQYEYRVPSWCLCIIANSDYSGLEDSEIEAFEAWEQGIKERHGKDAQIIATDVELGFCAHNDVDDYADLCYQATVLVPTK
jgi:hypothetical protein